MKSSQKKLDYEKKRRAKFTESDKERMREYARLRQAHRRQSDREYLQKQRDMVRAGYEKNKEARTAYARQRTWETRLVCLKAYSFETEAACSCCGEKTPEFLTLDHIVDRRSDGGVRVGGNREGQSLYAWLIRMGFPAGFRAMCFNCNCAKGTRGYCPHELSLETEIEETQPCL